MGCMRSSHVAYSSEHLLHNLPISFFYLKILHASNSASIFIATAMSFFTLLSLQLSFWYSISYLLAPAYSEIEVLYIAYKPLQIKQNTWVQAYEDSL